MAENTKAAALPVESMNVQAEFQSAFARALEVPEGRTLIDDISDDDWLADEGAQIEAGAAGDDKDLHNADRSVPLSA